MLTNIITVGVTYFVFLLTCYCMQKSFNVYEEKKEK